MTPRTANLLSGIAGAFCLGLLVACGSGTGGPAMNAGEPVASAPDLTPGPEDPIPDPPPAAHHVTGEVFSFQTGMIDNAAMNVYVYTPTFVYSYWYFNSPVYTDGLGQFEVDVPDSELSFLAFKDGFVQPCASRPTVTGDMEVRIETLPVSAFNVLHAPRPQTSVEPSITGVIFENTGGGRSPLHDVHVWAENQWEIPIARTRTDLSGGLFLCNLPDNTHLHFTKDGYEPVRFGPIDATQPIVLEIELRRE